MSAITKKKSTENVVFVPTVDKINEKEGDLIYVGAHSQARYEALRMAKTLKRWAS